MIGIKKEHPKWALKHKKPGTELRLIKGKYYLYEYKTVYDKEKKRPKKISGVLLGAINEKDGFIPSAKRALENILVQKTFSGIQCKEYGMVSLILSAFKGYGKALEATFGEDWKYIIAIAYCRFIYRCPLKNIPFRLASSFLPESLGLGSFSEKQASGILNRIGGMPGAMLAYMKSFIGKGEYILMDATHVLSHSELIPLARKGYPGLAGQYDSQFTLMYIYSATNRMPVYYRLLPGNIREVKAFKNSLLEAGLQKAIIVADKGFYSEANISLLLKEKLKFILPLKRDNKLIAYQAIVQNTFKDGDSYFDHEKRAVWYKIYPVDKKINLFLFLDEQLRLKEESDYLKRIKTHPETHSIEAYHQIKQRFGTIALLSPVKTSAQDIYQTYKSRGAIEVMFDGMKNILEADHTYMQDEQTLQGWMFINHIALQWYQHLYIELKDKQLLKQIAVDDYIQLLTDVKKIYINGTWYLNEFTNHSQKLIDKIGIKLT